MTRPGMKAGVLALVAGLLIGSLASASDSDTPVTTAERIKELERSVRELREMLKYRDEESRFTRKEMDALHARLERIERSLQEMRSESTSRRAFSIDPTPRTGTIRLENELSVDATVRINGVPYRVPAGGTRLVRNVPVGTVRHQARTDDSDYGVVRRSRLTADRPLEIRVYDVRGELD